MMAAWTNLLLAVLLGCAWFAGLTSAHDEENAESYQIRMQREAGSSMTLYSFKKVNYVTFGMSACVKNTVQLGTEGWRLLPQLKIELAFGKDGDTNSITTRVGKPNEKVHTFKKKFFDKNDCPSDKFIRFYVKWAGLNGRIEFGTTDEVIAVVYDKNLQVENMDMDSRTVADFRIYNPAFRPSGECCEQRGNRYCVVPGMGCRFFTQDALGRGYLQKCGKNLQFNPKACLCDHAATTACNV